MNPNLPGNPVELSDELAAGLSLHDIHLPAPVGWWPPAPGWWLVALLSLLLLGWLLRTAWRSWRVWRWQRRLLADFGHFPQPLDKLSSTQFATVLSGQLRRLALTLFPATDVASLSGEAWLSFLEQHSPRGGFLHGAGRYLADGLYRSGGEELDAGQRKQLQQLAWQWARYNLQLSNRQAPEETFERGREKAREQPL